MRDEVPQSPDAAADHPPSPAAPRPYQAHDAVAGPGSAAPSEADEAGPPPAEHAEHADHADLTAPEPAAPTTTPAGQSSRLRHGLCPSCFIELPLSGICDTCD